MRTTEATSSGGASSDVSARMSAARCPSCAACAEQVVQSARCVRASAASSGERRPSAKSASRAKGMCRGVSLILRSDGAPEAPARPNSARAALKNTRGQDLRKSFLLQRVEQLLEAAGAGRADAAFGGAERGGDLGVGRRLRRVEEHLEERAAAVAQFRERRADEVLLFEPRERLVRQEPFVGEVVHLVVALALLGREGPERLRAADR